MTKQDNDDFAWNHTLVIKPVGFVKNKFKDPVLLAGKEGLKPGGNKDDMRSHVKEIKETTSEIVINPALDGILDGLADFSHALILYWPHLAGEGSRSLIRIHPMGRKDYDQVGVFASCSPARPNPVLVTAVKIVNIQDNILTVQGLDAVDQSPVLDIKPYHGHYMHVEGLKVSDWMERIQREVNA